MSLGIGWFWVMTWYFFRTFPRCSLYTLSLALLTFSWNKFLCIKYIRWMVHSSLFLCTMHSFTKGTINTISTKSVLSFILMKWFNRSILLFPSVLVGIYYYFNVPCMDGCFGASRSFPTETRRSTMAGYQTFSIVRWSWKSKDLFRKSFMGHGWISYHIHSI